MSDNWNCSGVGLRWIVQDYHSGACSKGQAYLVDDFLSFVDLCYC